MSKRVTPKPERKEKFTTRSGIPLKRVYTPEEVEDVDYGADIGLPGEHPYTRGPYPSMYRAFPWQIRQPMGFGTSESTAQRWKDLLARGGQVGYRPEEPATTLLLDMPTNYGLDSDHPLACHQVGSVGIAIDHYGDIADLMKDFPMDKGFANLVVHGSPAIITAMYVAAARALGYSIDKLRGSSKNDPFQSYICERIQLLPVAAEIRLCLDLLEYCTQYLPGWNPISVEAYGYRSAGCDAIQELAIGLATAAAYIEGGIARGLDVDLFAPRISFFLTSGVDLLEEVAKFRAARRIWARIMKDRFGAHSARALLFRTYVLTLPADYTAQQPYINIIRGTIQAMAAVLGGVQALGVTPYDEALAIPTLESHTLAIRTQQIVAEESGIANTVDPLGGSYCIEHLTQEIERRVRVYFGRIESWGDGKLLDGLVVGIEQGLLQREIDNTAIRRQREIESGEITVVGLNKYAMDEDVSPEIFKFDPAYRKTKLQRLEQFKKDRDTTKVKAALNKLRATAQSDANVMETLIEAVENQATVEETMQVFREVFGVSQFCRERNWAKWNRTPA